MEYIMLIVAVGYLAYISTNREERKAIELKPFKPLINKIKANIEYANKSVDDFLDEAIAAHDEHKRKKSC